jgi:hypothetical protein
MLDESDFQYAPDSKEFVENVLPIKSFDIDSVKVTGIIGIPNHSPLKKRLFQSLFYDPFMTVDRINQEIEVLYPIDPNLYVYDWHTFSLKQVIPLPAPDADFPQGIDFGQLTLLRSRFSQDMNAAQYGQLLNIDGITIISFWKAKEVQMEQGFRSLLYFFIDQTGRILHQVEHRLDQQLSAMIMPLARDTFLFFPNYAALNQEPEGYLTYKAVLKGH